MKKKILKKILRSYFYGRRGLGHVGVILSFLNFINTTYLASRGWIFLGALGYTEIATIMLAILAPILVLVGYVDFKKGYYQIEAGMSMEMHPYQYVISPKEKLLTIPIQLFLWRLLLKFYETQGVLAAEEKARFLQIIDRVQKYHMGQTLPDLKFNGE